MDSRILELLEAAPVDPLDSMVWRHMFNQTPPDRENDRGARWNPSGVPAIYCSMTRQGAIAEGDHALAVNRRRATPRRRVYEIHATLTRLVDLTDRELLRNLGVPDEVRAGDDLGPCQTIGEHVAWLGYDGMLIPSARSDADNVVIYPNNRELSSAFDFDDGEDITDEHPPPTPID